MIDWKIVAWVEQDATPWSKQAERGAACARIQHWKSAEIQSGF